ncbi:MAG: hypothetical protein AB7I27_11140 [Bacteriovoracaceae bacterium]
MKSLILLIFIIISCQKKSSTNNKVRPPLENPILTQSSLTKDWILSGTLHNININITGLIRGSITVAKSNNDFIVDVLFKSSSAKTLHIQNIHLGDECPTKDNDINQDGIIDILESLPVTKNVIIPIDGNLKTQDDGKFISPISDDFGNYQYSSFTQFNDILSDLLELDNDPFDEIAKLESKAEFNLENKVFVIYGVPESTVLPTSVAVLGKHPSFQILPIACAKLKLNQSRPGKIIDDDPTIEIAPNNDEEYR